MYKAMKKRTRLRETGASAARCSDTLLHRKHAKFAGHWHHRGGQAPPSAQAQSLSQTQNRTIRSQRRTFLYLYQSVCHTQIIPHRRFPCQRHRELILQAMQRTAHKHQASSL